MPMPSREVTAAVLEWPQADRDALLLYLIAQLGFDVQLPYGHDAIGASMNRQEIERSLLEFRNAYNQMLVADHNSNLAGSE